MHMCGLNLFVGFKFLFLNFKFYLLKLIDLQLFIISYCFSLSRVWRNKICIPEADILIILLVWFLIPISNLLIFFFFKNF